MTVRALVVGCDDYPNLAGGSLRGAVADALAVRSWLLESGGVRPGDLRFLASCSADGAPVPAEVTVDGPADLSCLTREVEDLVTRRRADRAYVYLAGHGCRTDPDHPYLAQDALVLGNFHPAHPQDSCVAVKELRTQLAQADIAEVILILDCCRDFPAVGPVRLAGFGRNWRGLRRSGAAVQFLLQARTSGEPTHAGSGVAAPGSAAACESFTTMMLKGLAGAGPASVLDGNDDGATSRVVRWSSLSGFLHAAFRAQPPITVGQDPGLVLAQLSDAQVAADRPAPIAPGSDGTGDARVGSTDPNVMLTIEDSFGTSTAVGVGSITGSLAGGTYTVVLADPAGIDARVSFDVAAGRASELSLEPADRPDGFRVDTSGALRWSSPAAQLAAATRQIWAHGHRAFLLVGGSAAVPPPARVIAGYPQRFEHAGPLLPGDQGWWVALPVRGPWRSIQLGGHRITVPAAPDSVSAVAFTADTTTVALFDTTHAEPEQIAAQDRVQEYLAGGRLGAADLTSRFTVEAGQRWPWGATAAIRRLIDRTRQARAASDSAPHGATPEGGPVPDEPPHQFVADVPPDQRHRLLGRGPWAVWLDWP